MVTLKEGFGQFHSSSASNSLLAGKRRQEKCSRGGSVAGYEQVLNLCLPVLNPYTLGESFHLLSDTTYWHFT